MNCPKCQFENPEDSTFCGKYGSPLEVIYPNCGAKPPASFNFCNKCGHELRKLKKAPPVNYSEPQSCTPKHLVDKILTTRSSIGGDQKRHYFHRSPKCEVRVKGMEEEQK